MGGEEGSLYEPLLVQPPLGRGAGTTTATGSGQGQQQGAANEREEQEQEERAAVFRNSLFAEAGERERDTDRECERDRGGRLDALTLFTDDRLVLSEL